MDSIMYPPRSGAVSHNHYSHSKIFTPLSQYLKLTILEKRLIESVSSRAIMDSIHRRILL